MINEKVLSLYIGICSEQTTEGIIIIPLISKL